ncbi:HI1506-related protein [Desulfobulbus elongatus]|uniref:HI1506-related protein n=1 Tax=Desulfobulbus elongatus TaxID=53332 RepID=UPI00048A3DC4|nr:HI1506-related protein [Desulfobulbus elongatus]
MLIITSKQDGFRRCGVAHPAASTEYPDGAFTPAQIEALRADPMLVVLEAEAAKAELTDKPMPAADMIALARLAATAEELDKLAEGEIRKTVLEVIAARRKELTG